MIGIDVLYGAKGPSLLLLKAYAVPFLATGLSTLQARDRAELHEVEDHFLQFRPVSGQSFRKLCNATRNLLRDKIENLIKIKYKSRCNLII